MKKSKILIFILSVSIVAFVVLLYVYFFSIREFEEMTGESEIDSSLTLKDEKITVYLDKNNNLTKDSEEPICEQCIGKQIKSEIETPEGKKVISSNITEGGILELNDSKVFMSWGYFQDLKIIIPVFSYSKDQEGQEINIPALEFAQIIEGENLNLSSIREDKISEGYYETEFNFQALIPAIENAIMSEKSIWLVYYPNKENIEEYFISLAKPPAENGSLQFRGVWHIETGQENISNSQNYSLLLPVL